jgi:CheY-like chemotaxis protein
VQGGEITIRVGVEAPHVKLTVQDNGPGIPRKDKGRIFEPFWTTKGCKGTGMGLSGSLGIVQRHGGTISVESREGEGALFTVVLPLSEEEMKTEQSAAAYAPGFQLNILVVDDMPAITRQLESALTQFGQTVSTALDGGQALRIFSEQHIDLIICDLGMPGLNGWQVGESIKDICRKQGRAKPPFIMLTGWGGQLNQQDRMRRGGVDRIVEKPIDLGKLMNIVCELTHAGSPEKG